MNRSRLTRAETAVLPNAKSGGVDGARSVLLEMLACSRVVRLPVGSREIQFSTVDRETLSRALPGEADHWLGYKITTNDALPTGTALVLGAGSILKAVLDLKTGALSSL